MEGSYTYTYLLSLDWGQAEFHLWGFEREGHGFLEDGFQTFVLDMGSTNSRAEVFPVQGDENSMLHLQSFFLLSRCNDAADNPAVGTSEMGSHSSGSDVQEEAR